jgi:hypothetical protein
MLGFYGNWEFAQIGHETNPWLNMVLWPYLNMVFFESRIGMKPMLKLGLPQISPHHLSKSHVWMILGFLPFSYVFIFFPEILQLVMQSCHSDASWPQGWALIPSGFFKRGWKIAHLHPFIDDFLS